MSARTTAAFAGIVTATSIVLTAQIQVPAAAVVTRSSRPPAVTLAGARAMGMRTQHLTTPAVAPTCGGLTATIVGTGGNDLVFGTPDADVVWLGPGNDEFYDQTDNDGADVVCGGADADILDDGLGDDRLYGQGGRDRLYGRQGVNVLDGGAERDALYVCIPSCGDTHGGTSVLRGGDSFRDGVFIGGIAEGLVIDVPAGTMNGGLKATLSGIEGFQLTGFHDVFRGGPAAESLATTNGRDEVSMGAGDDFIGDAATGQVRMGPGSDFVGLEHLAGPAATVWLGAGDDTAAIGAGVKLFAGPGDDRVTAAGPGIRYTWTARGEAGIDFLDLDYTRTPVRLDARRGILTMLNSGNVNTAAGFDRYRGTRFDDVLLGSDRADTIRGNSGDDVLRGRNGNDVLLGADGDDLIRGERGFDTCSRGHGSRCERLI